jgi:hypothetical protein
MKLFSRLTLGWLPMTAMLSILAVMPLRILGPLDVAMAATANPSSGSVGNYLFPMHISGQYTATTTAVGKWLRPYPCEITHFSAAARASGGTSPTLSVVLKNGANTVSTVAVTAGAAPTEGTLANTSIADETVMTIDFTIGGTSPTWNDIQVLFGCKRQ